MRPFAVLCLLSLVACGAQGAPETPGVVLSGEASAGVVVK